MYRSSDRLQLIRPHSPSDIRRSDLRNTETLLNVRCDFQRVSCSVFMFSTFNFTSVQPHGNVSSLCSEADGPCYKCWSRDLNTGLWFWPLCCNLLQTVFILIFIRSELLLLNLRLTSPSCSHWEINSCGGNYLLEEH